MSDFEREENEALRCKAKFAGCRCHKRSGHQGTHVHDGAAGRHEWGVKHTRKRSFR